MKVRGKEIKFLRTVQTTIDLIEIAPDKDANRITELFTGSVDTVLKNGAVLIHSLNKGYEMSKHREDPTYEPQIISVEDIMYLSQEQFNELLNEAIKEFTNVETTVETEKSKKK